MHLLQIYDKKKKSLPTLVQSLQRAIEIIVSFLFGSIAFKICLQQW